MSGTLILDAEESTPDLRRQHVGFYFVNFNMKCCYMSSVFLNANKNKREESVVQDKQEQAAVWRYDGRVEITLNCSSWG